MIHQLSTAPRLSLLSPSVRIYSPEPHTGSVKQFAKSVWQWPSPVPSQTLSKSSLCPTNHPKDSNSYGMLRIPIGLWRPYGDPHRVSTRAEKWLESSRSLLTEFTYERKSILPHPPPPPPRHIPSGNLLTASAVPSGLAFKRGISSSHASENSEIVRFSLVSLLRDDFYYG